MTRDQISKLHNTTRNPAPMNKSLMHKFLAQGKTVTVTVYECSYVVQCGSNSRHVQPQTGRQLVSMAKSKDKQISYNIRKEM